MKKQPKKPKKPMMKELNMGMDMKQDKKMLKGKKNAGKNGKVC